MELKELAKILRRRRITIVAMFLVAMAVATAVTLLMTPKYESKAEIFISSDAQTLAENTSATTGVLYKISSYANLATHQEVLDRVSQKLDPPLSPDQLEGKVSAEAEATSVILTVKALDEDPAEAQRIARAESEVLAQYIEEIETPRGQNRSQMTTTITNSASYNADAVSPKTVINFAAAAAIGLILGLALALIRDLLDHTLKNPADIEKVAGAPIMASVAFDRTVTKTPLLSDVQGFSPRSEAFRLLRTNLQYLDLDSQPKSLVITSPMPAEGKTSTSTNLAIALAQAGRRVLLVDGDLRRPRVADLLDLEAKVGLTTVLVGKSTLAESIQTHKPTGLSFLAGGPIPPNPTEVLQAAATRDLVRGLRDMFDIVIIDAPPLLPVADAAILAHSADGALLVMRHGKTTTEELTAAADRLDSVGARLFGVVTNMVPKRDAGGYQYYYYDDEQLIDLKLQKARDKD
ncbi:receptor protein-tyrosine kinase [Nocardioides daedukensis]|uniref:non-specific protein-tyrosine kinase n=1 Tax=Nocardioides daedukensis TaxID=634462 RepID=A0A7Y9S015_9ACTN|nr:receptor protein-tyrosine kinase [Nocardioides daedukensis]